MCKILGSGVLPLEWSSTFLTSIQTKQQQTQTDKPRIWLHCFSVRFFLYLYLIFPPPGSPQVCSLYHTHKACVLFFLFFCLIVLNEHSN